jgi:hypothetical protein
MSETIVVLGKTSINKVEYEPLYNIGRAIALRDKVLRTTATKGVCEAVIAGYVSEGGEVEYIKKGENPTEGAKGVLVFTNSAYQAKLSERFPNWRDQNWIVFHNRKATVDAAAMIAELLEGWGTPL